VAFQHEVDDRNACARLQRFAQSPQIIDVVVDVVIDVDLRR
jgi:hypothetical protein